MERYLPDGLNKRYDLETLNLALNLVGDYFYS